MCLNLHFLIKKIIDKEYLDIFCPLKEDNTRSSYSSIIWQIGITQRRALAIMVAHLIVSPKIYVEALTPSMTVCRDRA